ncbi:hypothetical protein OIU35_30660 [Boseaceae bacterium BT-24-1]|nr:hypothetical protein [Boseaceae bacterium BT-24-1]
MTTSGTKATGLRGYTARTVSSRGHRRSCRHLCLRSCPGHRRRPGRNRPDAFPGPSKSGTDISTECDRIADLIGKALTELRVFTYLLHPPNLAHDGLQATLEQFIAGFARRTGLEATTAISEEIDDLPDAVQRSLLRVVQEALTNVHRHAHASRVSVQARIFTDRLVIRIRDDGIGLFTRKKGDGSPLLGVGIRGMNARLQQIDGRLMVRSRSTGTVVMAVVRLSRPKPSTILRRVFGSARLSARSMHAGPWRSYLAPERTIAGTGRAARSESASFSVLRSYFQGFAGSTAGFRTVISGEIVLTRHQQFERHEPRGQLLSAQKAGR